MINRNATSYLLLENLKFDGIEYRADQWHYLVTIIDDLITPEQMTQWYAMRSQHVRKS